MLFVSVLIMECRFQRMVMEQGEWGVGEGMDVEGECWRKGDTQECK